MAAHPSILAGECHRQNSLVGYAVPGIAKSWTGLHNAYSLQIHKIHPFNVYNFYFVLFLLC